MKKSVDLSWNIADILGFEVYDKDGIKLGLLTEVMTTGSNDIWVVKSDEDEVLIPALKTIITSVNIARKKIFVCLPDGYDDAYSTKIKSADGIDYLGFKVYED